MSGVKSHLHIVLSLLLIAALICGTAEAAVSAAAETVPSDADDKVWQVGADILITEIMLRNHATVRDVDGEFPDWIELYNNTGSDLNLEGWSLTDKLSRDGLVFPAYLLPADTYFIVFASGKGRPEDLHAPFSLSAGEELFLRTPAGEVVSRIECPDLKADRSYALRPD